MNPINALYPKSLRSALSATAMPNVMVVAGGTDILVKIHDQVISSKRKFVILEHVKPLRRIKEGSDAVLIGSMSTFSDIEKSKLLHKHAPQLSEAAAIAASVQIRNRATIGGNIVNASPAGDLLPPLYCLGASLRLDSIRGSRNVRIEDFFLGPGKTILKPDELIISIRIPRAGGSGFFLRLATRRAMAISKVSVAASIIIKKNIIGNARIALGAVGPTVLRASETEAYLLNKKLSEKVIDDACNIVIEEACPIDDIRSNARYRREMVSVILRRGLRNILK